MTFNKKKLNKPRRSQNQLLHLLKLAHHVALNALDRDGEVEIFIGLEGRAGGRRACGGCRSPRPSSWRGSAAVTSSSATASRRVSISGRSVWPPHNVGVGSVPNCSSRRSAGCVRRTGVRCGSTGRMSRQLGSIGVSACK